MDNIIGFVINSVLLGVGLAMDAFSVSMANALRENRMSPLRMCAVAGTFAVFQALMPMTGWVCVHTVAERFEAFQKCVPFIALGLLGWIGGKMLWDGLRHTDEGDGADAAALTVRVLLVQGVATSIDALSVGFTIADYDWAMALAASLIIAAVTFVICMGGLVIGKKAGTVLSDKATVLGGIILIGIGVEIFLSNIL